MGAVMLTLGSYMATRGHFCPRLQCIIWSGDTDPQRWFIAERKIAFCFDRRDAIRKGRQGKQNVSLCLRNGWQRRTSQVDSQSVLIFADFPSLCWFAVFWLLAQVLVLQTVTEVCSSICAWSRFLRYQAFWFVPFIILTMSRESLLNYNWGGIRYHIKW